jgi:hypothetical protein
LMTNDTDGKALATTSRHLALNSWRHKRPAYQAARLIKPQTLSKGPLPLPALSVARDDAAVIRRPNTTLRRITLKRQSATVGLKELQLRAHPI